MMQTEWYPNDDLRKFLYDAAKVAIAACRPGVGISLDDLQGDSKLPVICKARAVCVKLLQRSLWVDRKPRGINKSVEVAVSPCRPTDGKDAVSTPMLGFWMGMDHTSILIILRRLHYEFEVNVAELALSGIYSERRQMQITRKPPPPHSMHVS